MADSTVRSLLVVGPCGRDTGGVARYIRGQAAELADHLDVTVYNTGSPSGKEALAEGGVAKALWILRAGLSAVLNVLLFPFYMTGDVVHVHASAWVSFYRETMYVVLASRLWDRPTVLHIHGSDFDGFLEAAGPIQDAYIRWVFSHCDEVIVLSEYWADVLRRESTVENVTVLANPVRADQYDPVFDVEPPRIVYLSNLIERKGVEEFVTAVRRLAERSDEDFAVEIAGKGDKVDLVTELATDLDSVTYHGFVSESEKRAVLNQGSIYVLPTYAEGLPIALLEGMAAGNAIISTTVGSIPEVVGDENGILVSPVDVDELVAAFEGLLSDDDRRTGMARTNRAAVEAKYTWDHSSDQLLVIYNQISQEEEPRRELVELDVRANS